MDAMRHPDPLVEPAALLEIIERPAPKFLTIAVLIRGLGEMRVQPHAGRAASSAVARISDVVTENGEHGASAICTMAPSPAW